MDMNHHWTVALTRGGRVESLHRGHCAVVDAQGALRALWGDAGRVVFPRSSFKMIQALPLAMAAEGMLSAPSPQWLALACGSHQGQPFHVQAIEAWLEALRLGEQDLVCGMARPQRDGDALALAAAGKDVWRRVHHNCSGKHCGLLQVCRHEGWSVAEYALPGHPLQRRIDALLRELSAVPDDGLFWGEDGCGLPTPALPLHHLARAMAVLGQRGQHPQSTLLGQAAGRLISAVRACPAWTAGEDALAVRVVAATGGRVWIKSGAEGMHVAMVPEAGLGLALKAEDGAHRASELALLWVLAEMGLLEGRARVELEASMHPPLCNDAGRPVGRMVWGGVTPLRG
ncbi:MAG: asparaginase [Magnetococcus sp. WYHC-3]